MQTVQIIINILLLVAAVLLIIVVLLQESKSAGLGAAFGGETTALGSKRNAKVQKEAKLQKATIILAIAVGVFALALLILS
ncbi:MAG: preprotein translocase subunit SecG [Clostridia bacterium]|nr:preprotein translocase subunit SecG [Clostridia bacterium]